MLETMKLFPGSLARVAFSATASGERWSSMVVDSWGQPKSSDLTDGKVEQ